MQVIQTKFNGPCASNKYKPTITAKCESGKLVLDYPDNPSMTIEQCHASAAMALVRKMGWIPRRGYNPFWAAGAVTGGYVFVAVESAVCYSASFKEIKDVVVSQVDQGAKV